MTRKAYFFQASIRSRGQTLVEYMLLMGIVTSILFAMGPLFKRFTQGMVKLVADQVGNQAASDQQDIKAGFLINSYLQSQMTGQVTREDRLGNTTYYPETLLESDIDQYSNLGFTEE